MATFETAICLIEMPQATQQYSPQVFTRLCAPDLSPGWRVVKLVPIEEGSHKSIMLNAESETFNQKLLVHWERYITDQPETLPPV